ncbi:MAG TPA: hypothetical protein DD708_00410 [Deltaproteobacteria bacterium]|nr:hypothetical protein [Deltaproteobacteria bacterium]
MNQRNNQRGQSLIETTLIIPIILLFLFFSIQFSYVTITKRIQEWASFRMARQLLPLPIENKLTPITAEIEARAILSKIPFQKSIPIIIWKNTLSEVEVSLQHTIFLLGKPYELKNKVTFYR